jgi:hypothetical protein
LIYGGNKESDLLLIGYFLRKDGHVVSYRNMCLSAPFKQVTDFHETLYDFIPYFRYKSYKYSINIFLNKMYEMFLPVLRIVNTATVHNFRFNVWQLSGHDNPN